MQVLCPWEDYMLFSEAFIYLWCNAPFPAVLPLVYVALKAQLLTHSYFVGYKWHAYI